MRSRRSVTMQPIGQPSRILKPATDLRALVTTGFWPLTAALVLGIFGASAVPPVLNAFTTELFPTDLRGDAFAWSNNLIGRIGYVLSPIAVGQAAPHFGWGPSVASTAGALVAALVLVWILLPETNAKELEETAAV